MKTITLTDEAYERLKDWKENARDSFSSVVLRVVPKRGTIADMLDSFKQLPPLSDEQAQVMEEAVAWANQWSNYRDPWLTDDESEVDAAPTTKNV
jgi:predicted CopG family antitoxin